MIARGVKCDRFDSDDGYLDRFRHLDKAGGRRCGAYTGGVVLSK